MSLKHFRDIILGYEITVYTDHAAVTELFKGNYLTGKLARWYLTIQEFSQELKFIQFIQVTKVSLEKSRYTNVVTGKIFLRN